jgi:hypothetical protein
MGLFEDSPLPVPHSGILLERVTDELRRLIQCPPDIVSHDAQIDRNFGYSLELKRLNPGSSRMTVRVSTRRRVVGRWDVPFARNVEHGVWFFDPALHMVYSPDTDGPRLSPGSRDIQGSSAVTFIRFHAARPPDPLGPPFLMPDGTPPVWGLAPKRRDDLIKEWKRAWNANGREAINDLRDGWVWDAEGNPLIRKAAHPASGDGPFSGPTPQG